MTVEQDPSESSGAMPLLQAYVDGELSAEEAAEVAKTLEGDEAARAMVQQQAWVRAALQGVARDEAPERLRARVLAALDEVDREADTSASGNVIGLWSRMRGGLRAAAIMLPAAAAAGLVFTLAKQGTFDTAEGAEVTQAGVVAANTAPQDLLRDVANLEPQVGFPVRALAQPNAKGDAQLVSARVDSAAGPRAAVLEYEMNVDGGPRRLRHKQRHGAKIGIGPVGRRVSYGNTEFVLEHNASGAHVRFLIGDVLHVLSVDVPNAEPGRGSEDPAFGMLMRLGDELRRHH